MPEMNPEIWETGQEGEQYSKARSGVCTAEWKSKRARYFLRPLSSSVWTEKKNGKVARYKAGELADTTYKGFVCNRQKHSVLITCKHWGNNERLPLGDKFGTS